MSVIDMWPALGHAEDMIHLRGSSQDKSSDDGASRIKARSLVQSSGFW